MSKRIVICCDGTGNCLDNLNEDSNVAKSYSTLTLDAGSSLIRTPKGPLHRSDARSIVLAMSNRARLTAFLLLNAVWRYRARTATNDVPEPELRRDLSECRQRENGRCNTAGAAARMKSIRSQLGDLPDAGVVIYSVAPSKKGIAYVRLESAGRGKPVIEETVSDSSISAANFRRAVAAARQNGNKYYKDLLREEFPATTDGQRPSKARLFFGPQTGFGLVPQAFGFQNAVLLGSTDVRQAVDNFRRLNNGRGSTLKYAALIGIPRTEEEYLKTFGAPTGEASIRRSKNGYWRGRPLAI